MVVTRRNRTSAASGLALGLALLAGCTSGGAPAGAAERSPGAGPAEPSPVGEPSGAAGFPPAAGTSSPDASSAPQVASSAPPVASAPPVGSAPTTTPPTRPVDGGGPRTTLDVDVLVLPPDGDPVRTVAAPWLLDPCLPTAYPQDGNRVAMVSDRYAPGQGETPLRPTGSPCTTARTAPWSRCGGSSACCGPASAPGHRRRTGSPAGRTRSRRSRSGLRVCSRRR